MAYNLTVKGENVRIGNWFEEIRLKQDTGIRFYPEPKDPAGKLLTQSRCITHTEQTLPKDYASNLRDTIKDPKLHPDYIGKRATVGPRSMRLEDQIKNDINEEFKNRETANFMETRRVNYATTSKSTFNKDGFQPTLKENDPNLRIPTKAANYSTEPAITYYSHAVTNSDAKLSFPATFVGSTNPFKKSNAFSADVRSEIIARRTESNERPKPLPTLSEFRVLTRFRNQLLASAQSLSGGDGRGHTNGRAIRHIIDTVWNAQTNPEVVSYDVFSGLMSDVYGINISKEDGYALLSAFDSRTDGNISLAEFTNLIRRTPSPRRLQLIDAYYTSLDPSGAGIDYSAIKPSVLSANQNLQEFVSTLNWGPETKGCTPKVSVDDFFDFYIDLSAEVAENEELFEEVMASTWSR